MSLPFVASLRLNAPTSEICLLTRPGLVDFFTQVSDANRVIPLDEAAGRHSLRSVLRNARRLRNDRFDLAFCLPPSFGSALMMRLAGVKRRAGHASDHRAWLLTDTLPFLPNGRRLHRAEGYLELLGLVWQEPTIDRKLRYDPGTAAVANAEMILETHQCLQSPAILAVAPGAAQPNKMWSAARFAQVSRQWLANVSAVVLAIGGPSDMAVVEEVAAHVGDRRFVNLCGLGSLPLVAAILKRVHVFLGNDSGLAHLAAAVGARVVVISGPGDPSEVAPFVADAITIKQSLFCSPCYSNTCYRKDRPLECQELVTVTDVLDAVHTQQLTRTGDARHSPET